MNGESPFWKGAILSETGQKPCTLMQEPLTGVFATVLRCVYKNGHGWYDGLYIPFRPDVKIGRAHV